MSSNNLLLIAAVLASVAYAWHQPHHAVARETGDEDPNGFVAVAASPDAPANTVVILAPLNCPSAQAKRADLMAEQLGQMGIPTSRLNHYSVQQSSLSQPLMSRTKAVLSGQAPIVLINGMAKANPKVSEVAAEFQRGHELDTTTASPQTAARP